MPRRPLRCSRFCVAQRCVILQCAIPTTGCEAAAMAALFTGHELVLLLLLRKAFVALDFKLQWDSWDSDWNLSCHIRRYPVLWCQCPICSANSFLRQDDRFSIEGLLWSSCLMERWRDCVPRFENPCARECASQAELNGGSHGYLSQNCTQKLRNFPCEYAILTETQATSLHRKQTFLASDAGSTPGYVCQGQTFATTELDKSDANDDCCDLERKIDW